MSNGEKVEDIYRGESNLGDKIVVFKFLRVTERSDCFRGCRRQDEPNRGAPAQQHLPSLEQSLQSPLFREARIGRWTSAVSRFAAGKAAKPLGLRAMFTLR